MPQNKSSAPPHFSDLGLAPSILAILDRLHFTVPTPIQRQAIPIAVTGTDVIGIAQTGTGKTLAFALPLLQQIAQRKKRGLVILPTRELALQVDELLHRIGQTFGLRTALLIGGASMGKQIGDIRRHPHVIIGTPGRILDHLTQNTLNFREIAVLVLDEADRMLDMGFAPQIQRILPHVPKDRQTMLFSATMPSAIVQIAAKHMKTPVRVEVARTGSAPEKITQEIFLVQKEDKNRLLDTLLDQYKGTVLIFSRTKYGAKKICRAVRSMNHVAAEIHSNLSLSQRRHALDGFKSGLYRILVATDIAARGIDVTNIEVVINYDLPDHPGDYVHRIGRTGRAGRVGRAISFVTPDQRGSIRRIEQLVRDRLQISPLPTLPAHRQPLSHPVEERSEQRRKSVHHRYSPQHDGSRHPSRPHPFHTGRRAPRRHEHRRHAPR